MPTSAVQDVAVIFPWGDLTPGSHPPKTTLKWGSIQMEVEWFSVEEYTLGSRNPSLLTTLDKPPNFFASIPNKMILPMPQRNCETEAFIRVSTPPDTGPQPWRTDYRLP